MQRQSLFYLCLTPFGLRRQHLCNASVPVTQSSGFDVTNPTDGTRYQVRPNVVNIIAPSGPGGFRADGSSTRQATRIAVSKIINEFLQPLSGVEGTLLEVAQ